MLDFPALSDADRATLKRLYDVIEGREGPVVLGREGATEDVPPALYHILVNVIRRLRNGESVQILSQSEELTTQAAANYLGMSRPYFVRLLEAGEIPFHRVGTHRRVHLRDLIAYERTRDAERRESLDRLSQRLSDAGLYDSTYDHNSTSYKRTEPTIP